ncbi:MAG: undecaprenyl-phosphate glucose phosphotransferase [Nitrosomonas sp.]|jgi:Undecaprenyl-phosphate glucose phosphotransferase|nr:MAG: undecaprenyl-phosphate glucose phosphotransferase [Nitrosomonas sp.]
MTANDLPVVAFFKHLLDPFIIWASLILLAWAHGETFTGYYLILIVVTFFISTYVYEQTAIYRNWRRGRLLAYIRDTIIGWMIVVFILLLIGYAANFYSFYSERVIILWFIVAPLALISSHLIMRMIVAGMRADKKTRSAVIIGANDTSKKLINHINEFPFLFINLRGFFDERGDARIDDGFGPRLGDLRNVVQYVMQHNIDFVFISLPMSSQPRIRKLMDELPDTTTSVYFLPDIYIFDLMQAHVDKVGDVPVVSMVESPFTGLDGAVKSIFDFIFALLILIVLSPFMLCIALAVKISSPGPAIFKQRRYGLNGEEIIVYKFRSMTVSEDGANVKQAEKNDQRVTKIGAFLRRTSLDELPQFINVLQGRMSIVGPRPHAVAHNEFYRKLIRGYMLRHKAKPGITGWAQVNGYRGETEVLEKMQARVEHDLHYLQNWSVLFDLYIIARTVWVVLRRDNAY